MEKCKIEIFDKYIIKHINEISKSIELTNDEKDDLRKSLLLLCDEVYLDGFKAGFGKGIKHMTANKEKLCLNCEEKRKNNP